MWKGDRERGTGNEPLTPNESTATVSAYYYYDY